jgi:hypothetical protein
MNFSYNQKHELAKKTARTEGYIDGWSELRPARRCMLRHSLKQRAIQDSNLWPLAPEANALSN